MTENPEPILIDDAAGMDRFRQAVAGASIVGVDTESDSFFAYREKVCLLQVSTETEDFLIDPFAVEDLSFVKELLESRDLIKIFHAAENDVILLRYHLNMAVCNVFDTLIAAQVIGLSQCSLAGLLLEFFDIQLCKKEQRSDWRRRPLTDSQVHYAALDTRYLISLRSKLLDRMEELGRVEEASWDFLALENKEWSPRPFRPDDFVRIKGARDLPPMAVRVLRDLFVLRNEIASRIDTAPFRILSEATLLELARRRPRDEAGLRRIRSFPRRRGGIVADVLRTMDAACAKGGLAFPVPERGSGRPRLSEDETKVFDRLRRWRDRIATEREVATHRITKNELLMSIVRAAPRTMEELAGVTGLDPWRHEHYGPGILETVWEPEAG